MGVKVRSIQDEITHPFSVLMIVLSAVIISYTLFSTYYSSYKYLKQLEQEKAEYIKDEILAYLEKPFCINQHNNSIYQFDGVKNFTVAEFLTLFSDEYRHAKDLTLIGMGLENGFYIDFQYLDGTDFYYSERNNNTGIAKGWRVDSYGNLISLESEYIYDHRVRPWYIAAREGEVKWTPLYISTNPKSIFLSAVHPIFDESEFIGAMVSTLSVTEIGEIICKISCDEDRDVYLLDADNNIIASNKMEIPFDLVRDEPVMVNVYDSSNELLLSSCDLGLADGNIDLLWFENKPYLIGSYNINDGRGVDWQLVIIHSVFKQYKEILFRLFYIILFSSITILVIYVIGKKIGYGITKPIQEIKDAANLIVKGNLGKRVDVHKNDEFGAMGKSFNEMGDKIEDLISNLEEKVKERTKQLELSKQRLSLHIENTPLGVIEWDDKFNILAWNKGAERIFGYNEEEVVGKHSADLLIKDVHDDYERTVKVLDEIAKNSGSIHNVNFNVTKDGRTITCEWFNTTLVDSDGIVIGIASLVADITDQVVYIEKQEETNEELTNLSNTDDLTKISNRRKLESYLKTEWERAKRSKDELTVLMIDIDYFKKFNDMYGHLAGDQCLRKVARAIKGSIHRPADMAFRYGGEEFVCVLPDTDLNGGIHTANRVLDSVAKLKLEHKNSEVCEFVSISIGVATKLPNNDYTSNDILSLADKMLYKAKANGRNCIFSS